MNTEVLPQKKSRLNILKSENKTARILQIIARILAGLDTLAGLVIEAYYLILITAWVGAEGLIYIIPIVVLIFIYILSFKTELFGGILMIAEGIGFIFWFRAQFFAQVLNMAISVPFIISGILFIIAWYLEKYHKKE